MKPRDFDEADRVAQSAFARPASFRTMLELHHAMEPGGLWVATRDGRVAGTVSCIAYGRLAYIGLMAVDPPFQRRGIARQLINEALAWADDRCEIALLDATDAGAPLYEQLRFVDDSQAHVFQKMDGPSAAQQSFQARAAREQDLCEIIEFDALRFGASRAKLLRALWRDHASRALVVRNGRGALSGYLMARDPVLGPWAANSVGVAAELLVGALTLPYSQPPMVLVPRSNEDACELLTGHGFRETRRLRHMRRGGKGPPGRPSDLFGQSSFGHG
jgi:ribosomal protein S18 acetylase RimI-like enzyme